MVLVSIGTGLADVSHHLSGRDAGQYVRTARAEGARRIRGAVGHVLKNAMIPIVTYTMVPIPFLILGAFLMERYFSLPGVGDLMITSDDRQRQLPGAQGPHHDHRDRGYVRDPANRTSSTRGSTPRISLR